VVNNRLSAQRDTVIAGGKFSWKTSARDAYLAAGGKTAFKPTTWINAKDIIAKEHSWI
jgi:hypothetical protein